MGERDISFDASTDPDATLVEGTGRAEPAATLLVGRYQIGELLGRGGSGQVHRATDALTGAEVAVKFVRALSAGDRRQLRRELTALRLLDVPGVVRLLDDGEDRGQTFLVTELLPGGPLGALAGPYERWAAAARTLVETLARVHRAGVLHRDLKPANVLLDGAGRPVITDFGLAQGRSVEVSAGRAEGTPRYVAPEQWAGLPCDERSDLYALGAMWWEMLVGAPFPREGAELDRVLGAEAPAGLREVVRRLVSPDPRDRPASAEEVLSALGGGDPVLGPLPPLPDRVTAGDLEPLFAEARPTFFHLAADASALLAERSRGDGRRAREVLGGWVRAGRCHWEEGRLRLDRAALEALGWEDHPDARRMAALARERPEAEVARAALDAGDAAWDAGAPGRATAILASVLPLLDEPEPARAVLRRLAARALHLNDQASVRQASWGAERAADTELLLLLQGGRLCATQEMRRAADLLCRIRALPDELETWRLGLLTQALGRLDPAEQAAHLAASEAWCAADGLRRARWLGWRGMASYAAGRYEEALADHEASAERLRDHPVERLVALTNAAAAALETRSVDRASALASDAADLARQLRHPVAEAWATGLWRAARYRSGAPEAPRPELVDAAAAVSPAHEAQHALTEAAFAWRAGRPEAAELALRGARAYARLGYPDGQALVLGLAVAAGAEAEPGALRSLVSAARDPTLALQAAALGSLGTGELPVGAWIGAWHLSDPSARADVLSLDECRARLRAGQGFQ